MLASPAPRPASQRHAVVKERHLVSAQPARLQLDPCQSSPVVAAERLYLCAQSQRQLQLSLEAHARYISTLIEREGLHGKLENPRTRAALATLGMVPSAHEGPRPRSAPGQLSQVGGAARRQVCCALLGG